jgi:hypothetical protein
VGFDQRPNPPFQPMPQHGDKIGALLVARIGYNALALYRCDTPEWQPFGGKANHTTKLLLGPMRFVTVPVTSYPYTLGSLFRR